MGCCTDCTPGGAGLGGGGLRRSTGGSGKGGEGVPDGGDDGERVSDGFEVADVEPLPKTTKSAMPTPPPKRTRRRRTTRATIVPVEQRRGALFRTALRPCTATELSWRWIDATSPDRVKETSEPGSGEFWRSPGGEGGAEGDAAGSGASPGSTLEEGEREEEFDPMMSRCEHDLCETPDCGSLFFVPFSVKSRTSSRVRALRSTNKPTKPTTQTKVVQVQGQGASTSTYE